MQSDRFLCLMVTLYVQVSAVFVRDNEVSGGALKVTATCTRRADERAYLTTFCAALLVSSEYYGEVSLLSVCARAARHH